MILVQLLNMPTSLLDDQIKEGLEGEFFELPVADDDWPLVQKIDDVDVHQIALNQ
ncbi:hypothetical protein BD770DRAFT_442135 [Pilaira anomala]|nr:hypothetical protein BD770DRAFT_449829 [Pilaira anomala]KAI9360155.1 hypothetical protein BD770DRAFT_442135 [Pilaira anomala]